MFYHKKCGQNVYIDISKMFRFLINPVPGKNVFLARRGFIEPEKDVIDIEPKDFYCPNCKEVIDISDVIIRCMDCGIEIPMLEGYKNTDSGLVVCSDHKEKESKRLAIMARKISIKNI